MRIHHSPCKCPYNALIQVPCFIWFQNLGICEIIRFSNVSTAFTFAAEHSRKKNGIMCNEMLCDLMLEIQEKSVLDNLQTDPNHSPLNQVDEILSKHIYNVFQTHDQNGMFGYGTVLPDEEIAAYCQYGIIYTDWIPPRVGS